MMMMMMMMMMMNESRFDFGVLWTHTTGMGYTGEGCTGKYGIPF
jgi:hypothetical protein